MPKVVSRSAVSSSTDAQPTASSTAALRVYYCICGEFILVIDKSLTSLPRRQTDNAIIIRAQDNDTGKARIFKLNATSSEHPILIERKTGHERQFRFSCPRCSLPIGYQTSPPPAKSAPYLYIMAGSLSQLQGQDEVSRLRTYLPSQPTPSSTAPLSLPPAVSSILLSQLSTVVPGSAASSSSTVVAALTQRARLLQEENDELYELLRFSETGKLKEEVRGLRKLVQRLQSALRQSHETINMLSRELDKSYESYLSVAQRAPSPRMSPQAYPPSPRASYTASASGNASHGSKLPPTGPRAQKRPRLSESNAHPFTGSTKPHNTSSHNHYSHNSVKRGADGHPKRGDKDNRGGSDPNKGSRSSKMDVDSERPAPSEPTRVREKEPDREFDNKDRGRERNKERERDRGPKDQDHSSRDRDRGPNTNSGRRGGNASGRTGGRRGDRPGGGAFHGAGTSSSNNSYNVNGDRTLAERMGL
ncbi:hypothetical protein NP233_g8981 [Leucocoprinus birnbaumii]|uniref:STEEP1 domain-containing protein n=1 Tax=Leucocoprinus birnbaumii TaxID=56174 RepID=A0AAD5YT81_9AGAR|nr:hypothetical protein NP233_g8981 [Leucocoprinus birnbaumii]